MNLDSLMSYDDEMPSKGTGMSVKKLGVKDRLLQEARHLSDRFKEINEALSLLERNPDIERLINIIR